MTTPAITVLMPVYNAEPYLREAIDSILSQTFCNFEFLIINDGSSDKSEEIILSYTDKRIRYIKNEANLKLIATLNKGIELATGKYLVRTDADDINYLTRLELQFKFMEQNENVGLLGTGFETFGHNTETKTTSYALEHNTICFKHLYQIHLSHGTSIFRMSVIRKHNLLFDASYEHAEDYELWTRVSAVSKLANLPQVLYKVRQHNHKVSELYSAVQQKNSLRVKQNLFSKLGAKFSDEEITLFGNIAQHQYTIAEHFLSSATALLEKMVTANNTSAFFETEFFKKELGQFYFNTAYNSSALGWVSVTRFFNSSLSQYRPLRPLQKIKFFIKALLKK